MHQRQFQVWAGLFASVMLIAFGVAAIALGVNGRADVRDSLAAEHIVGTPDSKVAGHKIDTGSEAKSFATTMRKHTMEATQGQTYSEMGRFLDANGKPTNDQAKAAINKDTGAPVENGARNIWVTETALTTALNMSYFAERVALFGIMMGSALLLTGIGFFVLCLGPLRDTERARSRATNPKVLARA